MKASPTQQRMQAVVKAQADKHGLDVNRPADYQAAWRLAVKSDPELFGDITSRPGSGASVKQVATVTQSNQAQIATAVKEHGTKLGLDVATNEGYNTAWQSARRANPALFGVNDSLKGVESEADGQTLEAGWPVSPERLKRLGLPLNATQGAYHLFQTAEQTKLTPELAAVVVRTLIQFSQIERALTFSEAMSHVAKHRPELHKLAMEAATAKS